MPIQVTELNHLSLRDFRELFTSLHVPGIETMRGIFQATFVGPSWLRTVAKPALAITGLGGWWGKEFMASAVPNK